MVRLTLGGVGGAFGAREDVSLQIHACLLALAHRPPGEDGLLAARSRSSATCTATRPGSGCGTRADADGDDRELRGAHPARRRRVPVVELPRHRQRRVLRRRARTACPNAHVDGDRGAHEQPAVRRDARLRRGAGVLRARGADGPARRRVRARPGRAAAAQRARARRRAAHRPADRGHAAGRARCIRGVRRAAVARRPPPTTCSPGRAARAARPTPPTCAAASASRSGFKNLMYAEGYMDGSVARVPARRRRRRRSPARRPRSARASSRSCSRSRATVLGVDDVIVAPADTVDRLGRLHVGEPPDDDVGRRGREGVPRARAAAELGRRAPAGAAIRVDVAGARPTRPTPVDVDRGVPPPAHPPARRRRPGRRARVVRVRRAPGGRRRRPRARARARRAPRHRAGRRPGAQPAAGDRARSRAASPRASGLAVMEELIARRRPGPQPELHRLPDPDRARRADGRGDARSRSPSRARRSAPRVWASRRRSRRRPRSSPRSAPPPARRARACRCGRATSRAHDARCPSTTSRSRSRACGPASTRWPRSARSTAAACARLALTDDDRRGRDLVVTLDARPRPARRHRRDRQRRRHLAAPTAPTRR